MATIKQVLEAFGPCSTTYETVTLETMTLDEGETLQEWVSLAFTVEQAYLDRMDAGDLRTSYEAFLEGIRSRLAALGFEV